MPETADARFGMQAISGGDQVKQIDNENQAQLAQLVALAAIFKAGTLAARDVTAIVKSFYFANDKNRLFVAPSTSWLEVALAENPRIVTGSGNTAAGGDVCLAAADAAITLSASGSPRPITVIADASVSAAHPVTVTNPGGTTFLLPGSTTSPITLSSAGEIVTFALVGSIFVIVGGTKVPVSQALESFAVAGAITANGVGTGLSVTHNATIGDSLLVGSGGITTTGSVQTGVSSVVDSVSGSLVVEAGTTSLYLRAGASGSSVIIADTPASAVQIAGGGGATTVGGALITPAMSGTTLPSSPVDGQEFNLIVDATNGIVWRLRYRAASSSAHKWEFIGGSPSASGTMTGGTVGVGATVTIPGVSITVPAAGDYELRLEATGDAAGQIVFGVSVNGANPTSKQTSMSGYLSGGGGGSIQLVMASSDRFALNANDVLTVICRNGLVNSMDYSRARLMVTPVRVG